MYREGKGLRVNWFDLKILLNGSDRCQDQGSEWGMSAYVCVCACMCTQRYGLCLKHINTRQSNSLLILLRGSPGNPACRHHQEQC